MSWGEIPVSGCAEDVHSVKEPQTVTPSGTTSYFTEGEMLPWKGRWFKVRLLEIDGQKIIGLDMQKPTGKSRKLEARKLRWAKQHPKHQANAKSFASLLHTSPAPRSAQV